MFFLVSDSGSAILCVESSSDGKCGSVNTGGKAFGNLGLDYNNLIGGRDDDWWLADGGLSDADDISDALEGWNARGVDVHGDSGDIGGGWGDINGDDSDMGGEWGISDGDIDGKDSDMGGEEGISDGDIDDKDSDMGG